MSSVGLQIAVLLGLIIANGIFSMTEMAIVSSRKARLERRVEEGDAGAKIALKLADEPTTMLSTIQIGITLISILTGTFGGAALAKPFADELRYIPGVAAYADGISLTVVVSIITYLSLILGELVPKRLALNNPEPVASFVARPMQIFSKLASPVVKLLTLSTTLVVWLLGIKPSQEPPVTEDEIRILLEQGTEAGTFEKTEQDMVDRIFRLGDLRVYTLMTPRTQMVWLDLEEPLEQNLRIIIEHTHTRFPVARGSLDDFVGMIYANDLLTVQLQGKPIDLQACVREPLYIPKSMKAFKVLELFKQTGNHEAIVLDEFGGVVGLLTMHDIMEEIIGDMASLDEPSEPMVVQRDDGSLLIDGLLPVEEFKELFELDDLPEADRDLYHTVGGFVVSHLGYIPSASDSFDWGGLHFEIVDMDRVRVDKVLVHKLEETAK